MRTDLSGEAIRLGRVLAELMPDEPEAAGLLALMMLTDAPPPGPYRCRRQPRAPRRPDRTRWDRDLIAAGDEIVRDCLRRNQPGPYQLQAAIAAVHADAATAEATDWAHIVALYDHLYALQPTDVVWMNRAIAVAAIDGPRAGLAALETVTLDRYHLYHATRADLLTRLDRRVEVDAAFERAIELASNDAERRFLIARRAASEG